MLAAVRNTFTTTTRKLLAASYSNTAITSAKEVQQSHEKDATILASTTTPTPSSDEREVDKLYTKLEIELRGVDPEVLKSYAWFATTAANHLNINVGNCWAPRKAQHDRMTLLKSVHIYKKHRVQYEVRTYFRYMNFHKLTGSTLDTFLEYIERNLPEGVALNATRTEIQAMPEHLRQPPEEV